MHGPHSSHSLQLLCCDRKRRSIDDEVVKNIKSSSNVPAEMIYDTELMEPVAQNPSS